MRVFPIPFDLCEEEKTFGGVVSLRQVSYLLVAGIPAVIIALYPGLFLLIKLILVPALLLFSLALAFFKVKEERFDLYLILYLKYRRRKKQYILEGGS